MSQIKTVQLRDRRGNKISPFVPASTVYYIYGEGDDKRLANIETLIGSVDIDKINVLFALFLIYNYCILRFLKIIFLFAFLKSIYLKS